MAAVFEAEGASAERRLMRKVPVVRPDGRESRMGEGLLRISSFREVMLVSSMPAL